MRGNNWNRNMVPSWLREAPTPPARNPLVKDRRRRCRCGDPPSVWIDSLSGYRTYAWRKLLGNEIISMDGNDESWHKLWPLQLRANVPPTVRYAEQTAISKSLSETPSSQRLERHAAAKIAWESSVLKVRRPHRAGTSNRLWCSHSGEAQNGPQNDRSVIPFSWCCHDHGSNSALVSLSLTEKA